MHFCRTIDMVIYNRDNVISYSISFLNMASHISTYSFDSAFFVSLPNLKFLDDFCAHVRACWV